MHENTKQLGWAIFAVMPRYIRCLSAYNAAIKNSTFIFRK